MADVVSTVEGVAAVVRSDPTDVRAMDCAKKAFKGICPGIKWGVKTGLILANGCCCGCCGADLVGCVDATVDTAVVVCANDVFTVVTTGKRPAASVNGFV